METIKSKQDFEKVFQSGKRLNHRLVRLTVSPVEEGVRSRVAFVAAKRLGNAVCRNRCKRVLRAVARESSVAEVQGYDVVLIANRRTCDVAHAELVRSLDDLVKKAGMR